MRYLNYGLTIADEGRADQGYTLFSPLYQTVSYLIDMAGNVVHTWDLPGPPGNYGYLLQNGNLLVSTRSAGGPKLPAKGGLIQELDWDGNVVWEHLDACQHHDFRRCENGNTIYAGWREMPAEHVARIRAAVKAPEPGDTVWGDYLREVDPNGRTVWEWVGWEHMDIEALPLSVSSGSNIYAHINAIQPLGDDAVLVCFRHLDLVAVIDKASGQFRYTRSDPNWGGPHDAQRLPNGNMMLFLNRWGLGPRGSSVLEWDPASNETVWQYWGNPTHSFDSHYISGAQRLPGGNTLICEGLWGRFFEVNQQGDIVWEYVNLFTTEQTRGPSLGTVNAVFRAYRYFADGPELCGRLS